MCCKKVDGMLYEGCRYVVRRLTVCCKKVDGML